MAVTLRHGLALLAIGAVFVLASQFAVAADCEANCAQRRKECDGGCFRAQQDCALSCPFQGLQGAQECLANCAAKAIQCGAICAAHDETCKLACKVPPPPLPPPLPKRASQNSQTW